MTISHRKGYLTKAVAALKSTVTSFMASISEIYTEIRDKEPDSNTTFLPLGNEHLPVYRDQAALFFALITKYHEGSSRIIEDSEGVRKAMDCLRLECGIDGKEPDTLPDDISLAENAATTALGESETVRADWGFLAAKVTEWFTPSNKAIIDSAHGANQTANHTEGSHTAAADLQILQALKDLQSNMQMLQSEMIFMKTEIRDSKSRSQYRESISRTQSFVDDNSFAGNDSFINSVDDRSPPLRIPSQHSQPHVVPVDTYHKNRFSSSQLPANKPEVQQFNMQKQITTSAPRPVEVQPHIVQTPTVHEIYNRCPLPPMKAHAFDGKRTTFERFQTVFMITIGSNTSIPNVQKLLYLIDLVPTQDKLTISRYPLSDEGYRLAWRHLERKFGNTNDVAEELLSQLKKLTTANSSLPANKDMWLDAQSIVAQLELIEPVQSRVVNDVILHHFSPNLRREIYLAFTENTTKSWEEFSDITDRIILRRETEERRDELYGYELSHNQSKSTFRSSIPKQQKTYKCIYCESVDHYSSDCMIVPLQKRKEFLKNNGRCENCTGKGHTIERCASNISCPKCNGRHHRSLSCPQRPSYTAPQRIVTDVNTIQCKKPKSTGCGRPGGRKLRQDKPTGCPILHTLPILYGKLAGLDESVPILLDSGAQISLIEESLVKKLRLPVHGSSTLHVRGFQSDVTTAKSHAVNIELIGPSKFTLSTNVYTMKDMLMPVTMTEPTKNDKKFLHQHGLKLPQSFPAKTVQPLIIIGMDILWKVLDGLKVTNLPSGKCHFNTKLGSIITGPTMSIAQTSVVGQYHLLVAQEEVRKPSRDSDLSKLKDNYRIAVNTVQGLRQFSQFTKSLYPDLSDKYKTYKEKEGTTATCSTLKPSIEKRPPGASLASGRVCQADTIASFRSTSASRATGNQTFHLNDLIREIQQRKYHPSFQSRKKIQRQKNLPKKMSQACAESASPLPDNIHQTVPDVDIIPLSFPNTNSRRSPLPFDQTFSNHKEHITQTHTTKNRQTQRPTSNQMRQPAQTDKEARVPMVRTFTRRKGRIRDDDGDPRR